MQPQSFIATLAALAFATISGTSIRAQNSAINGLPPQIKQFADKIQTMNKSQISELIHNTWGKPTGDIGSGLHIPVWQLKEGELIMHPLQGPSFRHGGKSIVLLKTRTRSKDCLPGSYQVLYSKDSSNQFWCGQIDLKADGTYLYSPSGQKQIKFFAAQNPSGKYKFKYQIYPQMEMAKLDKPSTVATLTLISDDKRTQHYKINAKPATREFYWSGNDLSDITINLGWNSSLRIR
ncbi:MAG: hypothetical protein IPJ49_23160 [Candidatus Obscuribacter sp.]|jgi:hypothetical protein|nr:hypothetical protein [Candidatus Obscuribacter sp.]